MTEPDKSADAAPSSEAPKPKPKETKGATTSPGSPGFNAALLKARKKQLELMKERGEAKAEIDEVEAVIKELEKPAEKN